MSELTSSELKFTPPLLPAQLANTLLLLLCSSSSFTKLGSSLSVIVRPTAATTPGDILREVDGLGILAPVDYLVVQAGYVGNIDLKAKVDAFTQRRLADPTMTMDCIVAPRQVA